MKVRSYLALMALAILVPVVLFSALALDMLLSAERESQLQRMRELAGRMSLAADQRLNTAIATAHTLAASASLLQGNFKEFHQQALEANKHNGINLNLVDSNANVIINTALPFGKPLPPLLEANARQARDILVKGKPEVSNIFFPPRMGKHVVGYSLPVQINNDRYLLIQWLFADSFRPLLAGKDVPETWLVGLFDREGATIVRNQGDTNLIGGKPNAGLLEAILRQESGHIVHQSRDGRHVYSVMARSPLSGWTVSVGVPVAEVESAARRAIALTGAGLLLAILAATIVAVFFARRLVAAIGRAAASAALLGQGQLALSSVARQSTDSAVTELRQLQHSLQEAGSLLHDAEAARERHLAEVEQSRALAEAQNRAKDQFLAMLGHELRNPLAAVSAGVSLMSLPGVSDDQKKRALDVLGRQTEHLSRMVDELLDANRVLSGRLTLSQERVDVAAAVQASLETLQARGLGTELVISKQLQPAIIAGDPTRLDQMFTNVIENAFKFCAPGDMVRLSVHPEGDMAVVEICDTGPGMDADLLHRVFDLFVQGKMSDRSRGGLGIGLAVVRSLAIHHGGTVTAHSEGPGKGSTFRFSFPLLKPDGDQAAPAATPVAHSASLDGLTILIIEDNQDARAMLCERLAMEKCRVLAAGNGADGIRLARERHPHAVLIDIDLPDMTGHEVARALRADPLTTGAMLIAVTGFGQDSDRQKAKEAGFDEHLKKPLSFQALLALLETAHGRD
jgi:signal transduction histidine kinase/ActR/RegA family two-component response regulator